ncbi:lytic transglycosylase domain-containing protein [Vampirovibrio chlorellavorus]|uniref:lytic transglycosylase domain-containing protein n=1 Tax=Vampirovibrio chlorellavorus TaxID=758823 RepID=UPI0026F36BA4|nr:transglycosylase SLT domain-containing protein [Vampirovibrio chlorellavorus]
MLSPSQCIRLSMSKLKPPTAINQKTDTANRRSLYSFAFAGLGVITVLLAYIWFTRQADWLPEPMREVLLPLSGEQKIFVATVDVDRETARSLYRDALKNLQESNYEAALSQFKRIEPVYPGLQDFLWLHEAEAYAGQGNEWAVQKKLNSLLKSHAHSPLMATAIYRIGQSQFRGSEWDAAEKTFKSVRTDYPNTDYAIGSLYYLGALKNKSETTRTEAAELLKSYLKKCPDCKFSGEAADLLEKILPKPTPEEHTLIGIAAANRSEELKKALTHLTQGERQSTWLALGKTQLQAGQTQAGMQTLIDGLSFAKTTDETRAAIDALLAHTSGASQQMALLKTIQSKLPSVGGDYVLWKLAQLDEAQAPALYRQIVSQYSQGDYAPESGWQLLWPLLSSGQQARFIEEGQKYLAQYPYSKAAPKVLFWVGKLLEKSQPNEATRAYQRLTELYPANYYAFRASGRLRVLTQNRPDPGWPTLSNRSDYPPTNTDLNSLDILPKPDAFGAGQTGWYLRNAAKELQRIGATEDLKLLATETMGTVPASIESWAAQVSGDRAKGLRAIRDGLDQQVKDSFINSGRTAIQPAGTRDELKLLYPVYFAEFIRQAGSKNRLDPFLIQSLMREESYFNEFAISTSNARGLMQLLPSTAREVAGWEGLGGFQTPDLFTPAINIQLGSRYLAHLHELFSGNSMPAVGAYNGGPNAMKRWVQASNGFNSDPDMFVEKIPYDQSRDYIKKVFTSYWNYSRLYSQPAI